MTLVAGFTLGSTPILIGSVLVANATAASASSAASAARASAVLPEEYGPELAIRQRVTLINDHLALAWSGPLPAASFVLKQLRRRADGKGIAQSALDALLNEVDHDRHLSQLALVGVRLDESGVAHLFGRGVEQGEIGRSASRYFCEASAHDQFRSAMSTSVEVFSDGNPVLRGICAASALANVFLANNIDINKQIQSHAANPMLALYGGGYETVLVEDGRLKKMPTFVAFWRARLEAHRIQVEPPTIVIKREYAGRTLLLRWGWATKEGRHLNLPLKQQQCLAIGGADETAVPLYLDQRRWPRFRADTECHAVLVLGGGVGGVGTLTHRCASELDRDIRFGEPAGHLATRARLSMNAPLRIFESVERLRSAQA